MRTDNALAALRARTGASPGGHARLVQAGADGLAVGALRETRDIPAATLTAHLNVLRAAGLVAHQRQGRVIRGRADSQHMDALPGYLTDNCCAGAACAVPASTPRRSC